MLNAKSRSIPCNLKSGLLGPGPIRDFVVIMLNLIGPNLAVPRFSMVKWKTSALVTEKVDSKVTNTEYL